MPQKQLKPAKKKKQVASNHGKLSRTTKKGRMEKPPRRMALKKQHLEDRELSRAINTENEQGVAGMAAAAAGPLRVLKPPVVTTADEKQRNRMKPSRPGMLWGASSK